jgi:hypothetical protein
LPDDVDARELDPEVRRDLRSLAKDTGDTVARHLVVAERLLDEDPKQALAHARAAVALAGRVGVVREAAGLAAYAAEEWTEAIAELRAARRITGGAEHLAVIADCERALGRPERALALLDDPAVPQLEQTARVELVIVAAGARRDRGEVDAAVLLLQGPAKATSKRRPWAIRLWYAYADALLAAGRAEARDWFAAVVDLDADGQTDATDRLLDLDGVVLSEPDPDDGDAASDVAEEGLRRPEDGVDLSALVADIRPGTDPGAAGSTAAASTAARVEPVAESVIDEPAAAATAAVDGSVSPSVARPGIASPLFSDPARPDVTAARPVTPPVQGELFATGDEPD